MIEMIQMICDVTHRIGCRIARSSTCGLQKSSLVFSQFVVQFQNWGKESEGGWVALSRRALSFETNHAFELLVQKRLEFELVAYQS